MRRSNKPVVYLLPTSCLIIPSTFFYEQILTKLVWIESMDMYPDSKVHGANMGPIYVLSVPDGPHAGCMNLAIRVITAAKTPGSYQSSIF